MTIVTRRMGRPKAAALCHTKVLNSVKHFIKTANGISKESIQASPALPLSGKYHLGGKICFSWRGGYLVLEKCVLSFIRWQTKKGREVLGSIQELPGDIQILTRRNTPVKINRIEAWDTKRISGVRCALDGNDDTEFKYRLNEENALTGRITTAPLTRFDTEVVFRERWMASIK